MDPDGHRHPQSSSILEPDSLDRIYTNPSIENQSARWSHLIRSFHQTFDQHPTPQFIARAPGRVNIIGEHIDYCGFSVLPAAIEPDLLICGSVVYRDNELDTIDRTVEKNFDQEINKVDQKNVQVKLVNLNPVYPQISFEYNPSAQIPIGHGGWSDYIKSSFNVCLDHLRHSSGLIELRLPSSIQLLIDGTVPPGSGLSSSAAITTASVLTVLHIHRSNQHQISKDLVASLAIKAERACGINVGGMDQTASVFGQPDKLLHIEFEPETLVVPLEFPRLPSTTFIIANSLVTSKKLDSSKEQYNLRVVECRIATRILYDHLLSSTTSSVEGGSQRGGDHGYPKHLRELVRLYSAEQSIPSAIQSVLDGLSEVEDRLGGLEGLKLDSILLNLGIDRDRFESEVLDGMVVEPRHGIFKPYRRVRHVLTEALRVYKFRELLETAAAAISKASAEQAEEVILGIGRLMNESQESCRDDYECSCDEIDRLVSIARSSGSLGSRLTGAGWGGSTVHLVRDEGIESLIESLKSDYYFSSMTIGPSTGTSTRTDRDRPVMSSGELSEACFSTKPQGGACLFTRLDALSLV